MKKKKLQKVCGQKKKPTIIDIFQNQTFVPLEINNRWIEEIKKQIKELPDERKERFKKDYGLSDYDASVLISHKGIADYFEECVKLYKNPKTIANWIMGELLAQIKGKILKADEIPLKPSHLIEILNMIDAGKITGNIGKEIFKEAYITGVSPIEIVNRQNLIQIQDENLIEKVVEEVLKENEKAVNDWKKGKEQTIGFLVGQVMKKTKGKANPNLAKDVLIKYLKDLK